MPNLSLVQKIFAISPHVEMFARRVYWMNVKSLSQKAKKAKTVTSIQDVDFSKIKDFLKTSGIKNKDLLVVHSAFSALKGCKMKPDGVLDELIELIGTEGTLAMPAMPKFKNQVAVDEYLTKDTSDVVYEYDVQKTKISTGLLPGFLNKREGAIRSRHPINTMVALGPLSETITNGNLDGDSPLACGTNSSWKKCVDNDAFVIGLGTDLTHSLTMIHVAEDVLDEKWPVKEWYRDKKFIIKDGDFQEERTLRERVPKWGALHYGERTLCKDLINSGIMKSAVIDGVIVEVLKAKELIAFLNSKNASGYPYFWV